MGSWLTQELFSLLQVESTSQVKSWLLGLFAHPVNSVSVSSCLCCLQLRAGQEVLFLRSFVKKSASLVSASLGWSKQQSNAV